MSTGRARLGAVILAGGAGRRLGGADKASLEVAGRTLLEHALAATALAAETVVVGEQVTTSRPVVWTRESPPGGGPAAGLLAGLDAFGSPPELVCVLAVDMPGVHSGTVRRLADSVASADAAVLVDDAGRRQVLAGVYRYDALQAARPDQRQDEHGLAVRLLIGDLRCVEVAAVGDEAKDVDTWTDLDRLGGHAPDTPIDSP